MLKIDLKKRSKFHRNSLNIKQNRKQISFYKNQHSNQLIKAETYANVIKTITKMTKNENQKKSTTTNMMTTKKEKKLIIRIKSEIEKKRLKMLSNVEFFKKTKRITKDFKSKTIELK